MKLHDDNRLYIEYRDFIAAGWTEDAVRKANYRNGSNWMTIKNPTDRRIPMVEYESLTDQNKKKVQEKFGNPYDYVAKEPIKKMVQKDFKAEEFYRKTLLELSIDSTRLSEYVNKYCTAASWLNMLIEVNSNKKKLKTELKLNLADFWIHVCELINIEKIDLPASYKRLREKMDEYKSGGYTSLISGHFGNKRAAKIGKTEDGHSEEVAAQQIALIRKAASLHNNFDSMQITRFVNQIFEKNGWPTISNGTVKNVISENEHIITPGSRGVRVYNSTIAMQVKRERPAFPLYYFTLDGWTVELLYQDETGFNNRLVMVVVLDAMNNYPVGYAIGDRENTDLIREANRNAIIHIKELFGNAYRPWQLQSDHYGLKQLTPFYEAMSKLYIPAAVGNAKAKVIEPYFNYLNKEYFQRCPNWSGFNVNSSKKNQPNTEMLDKIKTSFPDKDGVIGQINMIMQQERKVKLPEYLQRWNEMPTGDKVLLQKEDMLMLFGKMHGFTNSITGMGLMPTINGQKLVYDSFNPQFRANQHLKWQVVYDENDMSSVLAISEDGKLRFVLDEKRAIPMDVKSSTAEDHQFLSQVRNFNLERREEIMQTYINDAELVEQVISNTPLSLNDYEEANLKLMFTYAGQQKEKIQDAKGLKRVQQQQLKKAEKAHVEEMGDWQTKQLNYLQSKTDFNQYID